MKSLHLSRPLCVYTTLRLRGPASFVRLRETEERRHDTNISRGEFLLKAPAPMSPLGGQIDSQGETYLVRKHTQSTPCVFFLTGFDLTFDGDKLCISP